MALINPKLGTHAHCANAVAFYKAGQHPATVICRKAIHLGFAPLNTAIADSALSTAILGLGWLVTYALPVKISITSQRLPSSVWYFLSEQLAGSFAACGLGFILLAFRFGDGLL